MIPLPSTFSNGVTVKMILIAAAAALLSAIQTPAVPFTYTGSTYTQANHPDIPGFTFQDRLTATLTLESALWGEEAFLPAITLNSGPYSKSESGALQTDSLGAVISWRIGLGGTNLRMISAGNPDGSGFDLTFTDSINQFPFVAHGRVDYPAGSPSRWSFARVPDAASTLLLLSLSLIPVFGCKTLS